MCKTTVASITFRESWNLRKKSWSPLSPTHQHLISTDVGIIDHHKLVGVIVPIDCRTLLWSFYDWVLLNFKHAMRFSSFFCFNSISLRWLKTKFITLTIATSKMERNEWQPHSNLNMWRQNEYTLSCINPAHSKMRVLHQRSVWRSCPKCGDHWQSFFYASFFDRPTHGSLVLPYVFHMKVLDL